MTDYPAIAFAPLALVEIWPLCVDVFHRIRRLNALKIPIYDSRVEPCRGSRNSFCMTGGT